MIKAKYTFFVCRVSQEKIDRKLSKMIKLTRISNDLFNVATFGFVDGKFLDSDKVFLDDLS